MNNENVAFSEAFANAKILNEFQSILKKITRTRKLKICLYHISQLVEFLEDDPIFDNLRFKWTKEKEEGTTRLHSLELQVYNYLKVYQSIEQFHLFLQGECLWIVLKMGQKPVSYDFFMIKELREFKSLYNFAEALAEAKSLNSVNAQIGLIGCNTATIIPDVQTTLLDRISEKLPGKTVTGFKGFYSRFFTTTS